MSSKKSDVVRKVTSAHQFTSRMASKKVEKTSNTIGQMKMTCVFQWEVSFATENELEAAHLKSLSSPGWSNKPP